MNDNEIEPWIVVLGNEADHALAMWRLAETDQPALAIFSTAESARRYAVEHGGPAWSVKQPPRTTLIEIMIECYQHDVQFAVLDPDQGTAKRIFNLREVLRAARDELR